MCLISEVVFIVLLFMVLFRNRFVLEGLVGFFDIVVLLRRESESFWMLLVIREEMEKDIKLNGM